MRAFTKKKYSHTQTEINRSAFLCTCDRIIYLSDAMDFDASLSAYRKFIPKEILV